MNVQQVYSDQRTKSSLPGYTTGTRIEYRIRIERTNYATSEAKRNEMNRNETSLNRH